MRKGGEPDTDFAGAWLIQAFRQGKLGRWTLDSLGRGGEAVDAELLAEDEDADVPRWSYLSATPPPGRPELTPEARVEVVERKVDESIGAFVQSQTAPSLEDMSGHQAKRVIKAAQAAVRDVKRKAKQVAQVKGPAISSARRRKYRRE